MSPLQAVDSLMMKMGEAANRLTRLEVLAPGGVDWALGVANRNFLIHRYDEINRELTWQTLATDLPEGKASPRPLFAVAHPALDCQAADSDRPVSE